MHVSMFDARSATFSDAYDMARYFFDVSDGSATLDVDGRDLANDDAARRHAMVVAADMAKSEEVFETGEAAIVVTARDADHRTVAVVRLIMDLTRH